MNIKNKWLQIIFWNIHEEDHEVEKLDSMVWKRKSEKHNILPVYGLKKILRVISIDLYEWLDNITQGFFQVQYLFLTRRF